MNRGASSGKPHADATILAHHLFGNVTAGRLDIGTDIQTIISYMPGQSVKHVVCCVCIGRAPGVPIHAHTYNIC